MTDQTKRDQIILRNKIALMLNANNAYLKAIENKGDEVKAAVLKRYEEQLADEQEDKNKNVLKNKIKNLNNVRAVFTFVFGISDRTVLTKKLKQFNEGDDFRFKQETINNIVKATNDMLADIDRFPNLRGLHPLKKEDFENTRNSSEEVYKFGEKLGFILPTTQNNTSEIYRRDRNGDFVIDRLGITRAIDEEFIAKLLPGHAYFMSKSLASDCLSEDKLDYKGVYSIFMPYKHDDLPLSYMRCTLRISYSLFVEKKAYVVRCKLNMPNINSPSDDNTKPVDRYQYRGRFTPINDKEHCLIYLDLDVNAVDNSFNISSNDKKVKIHPDVVTCIFSRIPKSKQYSTGILSSINQRLFKPERGTKKFDRVNYSTKVILARRTFSVGELNKQGIDISEAEYNFMQREPKHYKTLKDLSLDGGDAAYAAQFFAIEDSAAFMTQIDLEKNHTSSDPRPRNQVLDEQV